MIITDTVVLDPQKYFFFLYEEKKTFTKTGGLAMLGI